MALERYIHGETAHLVQYTHDRLEAFVTERTVCGRRLNLRLTTLPDSYHENCPDCYGRTKVVRVPTRVLRRAAPVPA